MTNIKGMVDTAMVKLWKTNGHKYYLKCRPNRMSLSGGIIIIFREAV